MLFCGGTIAMDKGPKGDLRPALTPEQLYSLVPKLKKFVSLKTKFITDIDSTNMSSKEWLKMIDAIHENQHNFDAIVITHGTDSMADSASAIAHAFGDTLKIPVVMTGSQSAPFELGSDAVPTLSGGSRRDYYNAGRKLWLVLTALF